jgi:hypothetical protein
MRGLALLPTREPIAKGVAGLIRINSQVPRAMSTVALANGPSTRPELPRQRLLLLTVSHEHPVSKAGSSQPIALSVRQDYALNVHEG